MRLRRIRFKDGRAPIEVLHTAMDFKADEEPENLRGALMRNAKLIASYGESGSALDGFILIGLFADGKRSLGFRMPARIPRELLPAYVAEMIRTDAITGKEAADEFDRRFQWVDR